jgi:hypothetical protein
LLWFEALGSTIGVGASGAEWYDGADIGPIAGDPQPQPLAQPLSQPMSQQPDERWPLNNRLSSPPPRR